MSLESGIWGTLELVSGNCVSDSRREVAYFWGEKVKSKFRKMREKLGSMDLINKSDMSQSDAC